MEGENGWEGVGDKLSSGGGDFSAGVLVFCGGGFFSPSP